MAKYYFADGTEFPMASNILETIQAIVDAATELVKIDEDLSNRRTRAYFAQTVADEELARLGAIRRWIDNTIDPVLGPADLAPRTASQRAARKIQSSTHKTLSKAVASVTRQRRRALEQSKDPAVFKRIPEIIEPLFHNHELPNLRWAVRYQNPTGNQATLRLSAAGDEKIKLKCTGDVSNSRFADRLTVEDFLPGLTLPIPHRGRMKRVNIEKYVVTHIEWGTESDRFRIQKKRRRLSDGYQVLVRGGHPIILPVHANDKSAGDEVVLAGEAHDQVVSFWQKVSEKMPELIALRDRVTSFYIGQFSILESRDPLLSAKALLTLIEPIISQIRQRHPQNALGILSKNKVMVSINQTELNKQLGEMKRGYHKLFSDAGLVPAKKQKSLPGMTPAPAPLHLPKEEAANDAKAKARLETERVATSPFSPIAIDIDLDDSAA